MAEKKWKRFLILYAGLLLIAGLIACIVLYKYCDVYEKTLPDEVIEEIFRSKTADDWYNEARNNCNLNNTEFENSLDLYENYLANSRLDDKKLSYRKEITLSNSKQTVYSIRSGITEIAAVTLIPKEGSHFGFGRHEWQLGSISAPDVLKRLSGYSARIFVPEGSKAFINGIEVGNAYRCDKVSIPSLSAYEVNVKPENNYSEFDVENLYGEITVTNNKDVPLSESRDEEGGRVYFEYPEVMHSVKITAPDDLKVYINGVEATNGKVSEGSVWNTVSYEVDRLFASPLVAAKDAKGNESLPAYKSDGRYSFMHGNNTAVQEELGHWAEEFFDAYMNYSSSAFSGERQGKLLNRTLRHSKMYDYVLNSVDAMQWAAKTEMQYDELNFDNFEMIDDESFICSVSYKANTIGQQYKDINEVYLDNAYELVFVKSNDMWLCSEMNSISD